MGRAKGKRESLPQTMEEGSCRMGLQLGGKRRVPISGRSRQWEQPTSPFYQKKKKRSLSLPSFLQLLWGLVVVWSVRLCVPLNETLCYGLHDVHAPGMVTSMWELDGNKYFHLKRTLKHIHCDFFYLEDPVSCCCGGPFVFMHSYLKLSLHTSFSTSFK